MTSKTACGGRAGCRLLSLTAMLLVAAGFVASAPAMAADYYVSSQGSDQADGKSPANAWRTLAKVNGSTFEPGDKILLRRGDIWREQIFPHSGSEADCITYGAYGTGEKPLLLGSIRKNAPADWREESPNIWVAGEVRPLEPELLKNPSFAADAAGWSLYCEGGASAKGDRDAETFDSAPAGYTIRCAKAGTNGSHIQWSTMRLPVVKDTTYRLAFRVKASKPFWLPAPVLMQQGAPWENYDPAAASSVGRVREEWTSQVRFYRSRKTDPSARLTFFLGKSLPEGASVSFDSLSFAACDANAALTCDVGNIIFSGEKSCGWKKFKPADLKAQGDYWYDPDTRTVKVYSEKNPAAQYSDIECALRQHIVDESGARYVVFENLAMKYGAAHGFGGGNTHHIIIRDCDISFIGGGKQNSDERTVRFGNGIEFWGNAHDNLVERCRLWEIYDAALTNQNTEHAVKQYNITYRRNVIWNSEYSFEYWNRPENSLTDNIVFEYNTCVNAGVNWGHDQRPDPSGRHLCFYSSSAAESNVIVRNNIFYEATKHAFFGQSRTRASLAALRIDQNCWYQPAGTMIHLKDADYTMDRFAAYQAETGKEQKSIAVDPKLTDVKHLDFHLTKQSPCIDANMGAVTEPTATTKSWYKDLFPICIHGKWGFIDATGQVVIQPAYDYACYFSEGLAAVGMNGRYDSQKEYGYIDKSGKMVIRLQPGYGFWFSEGLAWVDGPNGFIDKTGKIVLRAPDWTYCREFRDGLAKTMPLDSKHAPPDMNHKIGFIDKTGKYAIAPRFDDALDFSEGLAAVRIGDKWGFVDGNDQIVIGLIYESANYFNEGMTVVRVNGKCRYIDKAGKQSIAKEFDEAHGFSEGLAGVKIDGKWGFIDRTGAIVIEPRLCNVSSFFNGRAGIVVNKKHGYIDRAGKMVIEPIYVYGHFFLGELAGVSVESLLPDGSNYIYINRNGEVVWKPHTDIPAANVASQPAMPSRP